MPTMSSAKTMDKLTGTEFEQIVEKRCQKYIDAGIAHIKRYGVQAVYTKHGRDGQPGWQIIKSKPDYEGVIRGAYQLIFDCKVESGASFDLGRYRDETNGPKRRQLNHMFERSEYGVRCFFLIHWNARELKTKSEPAITYAFPVHPKMPFWVAFLNGEVKTLSRQECAELGRHIPWTLFGERDRAMQPDILAAIR